MPLQRVISLALFIILVAQPVYAGQRDKILVVKSSDIPFYQPALDGFIHGLATRGYSASTVDFTVISLTGVTGNDVQSIKDQLQKPYVLVLTLGTDATLAVAAQHPTPPCLFSMLVDPLSLGVVQSVDHPGGDFTGTPLLVSPGKQLEALQQIVPTVKKIGVLYTDGNQTSTDFLADAQAAATRLNIQIVAKPMKPTDGAARPTLEALAAQVDAFWLIVDPASAGADAVKDTLDVASRHHLPILGTSSANVHAGALLALSASFDDIGDVDAEMAVPLLSGAEKPAGMSVRGPRRALLSVNLQTAQDLKITVPASVLSLADEVFPVSAPKSGGS